LFSINFSIIISEIPPTFGAYVHYDRFTKENKTWNFNYFFSSRCELFRVSLNFHIYAIRFFPEYAAKAIKINLCASISSFLFRIIEAWRIFLRDVHLLLLSDEISNKSSYSRTEDCLHGDMEEDEFN
jgi:hypothetical protein